MKVEYYILLVPEMNKNECLTFVTFMKGLALRFYFLLAKVLCICLLTCHTCNNLSVKLSFCFSRTE